jgi:excisionase family DNA binding protein
MSTLAAGLAELVAKLEEVSDRNAASDASNAAGDRANSPLGPKWFDHECFTVGEAGEILGLSKASAFAAVNRGEIPSIRMGKRVIVPRRPLEKMLTGEA